MQQAAETVVAKRQISLWTEKEKGAFMDAYKVPPDCQHQDQNQITSLPAIPG